MYIKLNNTNFFSSAGAIGVLLNVDRVASLIESFNVSVDVRGVVDSGWFLDTEPYSPVECRDARTCPPMEAARRGMSIWQSYIPPACSNQHKPETCFLGYNLYPYINGTASL